MKSFFSSRMSKLNVLMMALTLSMPILNFSLIASAQKSCITTLRGEVVCGNPTNQQGSIPIDLTGVWDFESIYKKSVTSNGFINNVTEHFETVVEINSTGDTFTGKGLGVKSNINNPCLDPVINGTVKGHEVNFTTIYPSSSSCCPNEGGIFTGQIDSQGVLRGKTKPIRIPHGNCTIYYGGATTATKRTGF